MAPQPLCIASHLDPQLFGEIIGRVAALDNIRLQPADPMRPWDLPPDSAILLTSGAAHWKASRDRPPHWPPLALRWIQHVGAGVDDFPPWLLRSIPVATARGTSSDAIAEYALAAMLAHAKRWSETRVTGTEGWRRHRLGTLRGATIGLAGLGAIGSAITRLAAAFGPSFLAWRREPSGSAIECVGSLEELASRSDHLVIALPLTDATRGIISERVLARARPGLHLVNVARGELVDETALLAAIQSGRIGGASLDTLASEPPPIDHPFFTEPRIRITAHIAWSAPGAQRRIADKVALNIARHVEGRPPLDLVVPERGY